VSTASKIAALRAKTEANGCTADEARSAAAKVAELQAATREIRDPNLTPDEVAEILEHLDALGYSFVSVNEKRSPGSRYLESDSSLHGLFTHLLAKTPMRRLGSQEAGYFWHRLIDGYHVAEPERHPSGLQTSEAAHTTVRPLGAGQHTPGRRK
jgi:hypothetical protein